MSFKQKMYRVKLPKDSLASSLDGYLFDSWQQMVAVYTRGEAIKKAKAFAGKIEFSHEIDHESIIKDSISNTIEGYFYCTTQDELEAGENMQLWEPFETCGESEIEELQSNMEDTILCFLKSNKQAILNYLNAI